MREAREREREGKKERERERVRAATMRRLDEGEWQLARPGPVPFIITPGSVKVHGG